MQLECYNVLYNTLKRVSTKITGEGLGEEIKDIIIYRGVRRRAKENTAGHGGGHNLAPEVGLEPTPKPLLQRIADREIVAALTS